MKYLIHIFLIFICVTLFLGFNNAYAASGTLSFSQDRIVINHSQIIYCNGCTDVGPSMDVTLLGPGGSNSKTVTLSKTGTGTYASNFVKFCNSGCGPLDFVTAPGQHVTVEKSGYTTGSSDVFATGSFSPSYNVNFKTISPNSSVSSTCTNFGGDTDGDNICDAWENNLNYPSPCPSSGPGLCIRTNSANVQPYFLGCTQGSTHWSNVCPSPTKADIYYEIDYMLGHKPSDSTITAVANAFENSNYMSKNNIQGITFHAQLDEEIPHIDSLPYRGSSTAPGYDQIKYWWFGTEAERSYSNPSENLSSAWLNNNNAANKRSEKAQVFHYLIFAHNISGSGLETNTSGVAERPGNDAIVSLGSFSGMVGSDDDQAGTLLHEIGHTINLRHGGNQDTNCKPNYLSVMSYSLQFKTYVAERSIDFSQSDLADLVENSLNENIGVQASTPNGRYTAYGPSPGLKTLTGVPVDWNRDGDTIDNPAAPPQVTPDINNFGITTCMASTGQTLTGFKDWDKSILKLSSLGLLSNGQEDDSDAQFDENSQIDDAFGTNVEIMEITSDDYIEMHVQRIDSILKSLDNIPDSEFAGGVPQLRDSYTKDLNDIKELIKQNVDGNNTMIQAYENLDKLFLKLDGLGNDDIIMKTSPHLKSTRDLVGDVILSQSFSIGGAKDYLDLGRIENSRISTLPVPERFGAPYKQFMDGIQPAEIICNEGLEIAIKMDNSQKPVCLSPETKEELIKRGLVSDLTDS